MVALIISYRQADLRVELDLTPSGRLYISGIQRDRAFADRIPSFLKLTSTVQTDYEWHEFIEADVKLTELEATITLRANGAEQACRTYTLTELADSHATG